MAVKKLWSPTVFIFTLLWILLNYVAYYADDFMIIYGVDLDSLWIQAAEALAFPITWYVRVIEPVTLLPIPVVGRALNYCVELAYFYTLAFSATTITQVLNKNFVQKILTYLK